MWEFGFWREIFGWDIYLGVVSIYTIFSLWVWINGINVDSEEKIFNDWFLKVVVLEVREK